MFLFSFIGVIRIIPAYAGSTKSAAGWLRRRPDHPRIRGEHYAWPASAANPAGSSPHTRGARLGKKGVLDARRIIPAYAGSTRCRSRRRGRSRDHPRIRGEHRCRIGDSCRRAGSSPHTRGARVHPLVRLRVARIIPAYAGSTTLPWRPVPPEPDHPRIRGEHIDLRAAEDTTKGSSPHTRGAPGRPHGHVESRRIIPAYAGST